MVTRVESENARAAYHFFVYCFGYAMPYQVQTDESYNWWILLQERKNN
jgi:hypothetical protein